MSTYGTLRKVIAATAISAAIGLTSLAGGAVSADGPSLSDGTHTTAKKPGRTTFANIVLERGYVAPAAVDDGSIPTETISLNFDKAALKK